MKTLTPQDHAREPARPAKERRPGHERNRQRRAEPHQRRIEVGLMVGGQQKRPLGRNVFAPLDAQEIKGLKEKP